LASALVVHFYAWAPPTPHRSGSCVVVLLTTAASG
jgi:hypothetical protein